MYKKNESIPQIVFELLRSENWNWIAPKLSKVWYFKFGVLLTYTAIKFDTLFGFLQNFDMITPITLTNHVAKFESIPQILFELLHYKRWCVFFRTPDIRSWYHCLWFKWNYQIDHNIKLNIFSKTQIILSVDPGQILCVIRVCSLSVLLFFYVASVSLLAKYIRTTHWGQLFERHYGV